MLVFKTEVGGSIPSSPDAIWVLYDIQRCLAAVDLYMLHAPLATHYLALSNNYGLRTFSNYEFRYQTLSEQLSSATQKKPSFFSRKMLCILL